MVEMNDIAVEDEPGGSVAVDRALLASWRVRLLNILLTADTPKRTAAAFSCGVFLSFSPFLGLQIVIGFGAAYVLRLNRVAMFAGLCTNLPWIMVPWYTFTTVMAAAALGVETRDDLSAAFNSLLDMPIYQLQFWTTAVEILTPFFWSFLIGPTIVAAIVSVATYVLVVRTVTATRARAA
jgi:uncharacterized protein (DUF2062 family)